MPAEGTQHPERLIPFCQPSVWTVALRETLPVHQNMHYKTHEEFLPQSHHYTLFRFENKPTNICQHRSVTSILALGQMPGLYILHYVFFNSWCIWWHWYDGIVDEWHECSWVNDSENFFYCIVYFIHFNESIMWVHWISLCLMRMTIHFYSILWLCKTFTPCGLQGGVVVSTVASQQRVPGSIPTWGFSVWSLHVLPVYAWVLSGFSGFFPPSKNMHVRLTGDSKLS